MTAKLPPHDALAEKAVLGGVLIDTAAISDVAEILQPRHFYFEENRLVYTAILGLFDKSKAIDVVTVAAQLKEDGTLKKVGGTDYLTSLIDAVPTSAYVRHYAEIVKNMYIKRTLISVASELVEKSFEETGEVQELLNFAESEIFSLSQAFLHRDFMALRELLAESFERLERFMKSGAQTRGLATGFTALDRKLSGLQDSNLIILAARPGVGKTAFALNVAMNAALQSKAPVGFFSLEMSKEELVDRLLVGQADIDAWKLKTGKLDDEDYSRLTQAMGELSEAPIYIDDTPGASILEMRTKARKMKIEHDLKLIVVDYLQLAVPGKRFDSRVQEVGYVSQNLKNIARELQIPIIALSQLSRAIEHRGEKRPQLADLRESGCVAGETLITLADTGERVPIEDLVGRSGFHVWSMTPDLKIIKMPVSRVFRSGRKKLYTIHFRSGRSIRATANHKFRTYLEWKRLDQLKKGDRLAMPRHIQQPLDDNSDYPDAKLALLAHMIGDGCYVKSQPIHYTSETAHHISVVKQAASLLFNTDGRVVPQESWYHVYLPFPYRLTHHKRHPMIQWFSELGLTFARSHEKKVPESLFTCSERQIGLFLKHLWSTDGCIHIGEKLIRIYYATGSEILALQVQALLLRVGVQSHIRKVRQIKRNREMRPQYHIDVQGTYFQIMFLQKVGGFGSKKQVAEDALKILGRKKQNPNIDTIEVEAWKTLVEPEKEKAGIGWRAVCKRIHLPYCGTSLYKYSISRRRMLQLAEALDSELLRKYAQSDIYWEEIKSIEESTIEDVFDLTVPGTHNFIGSDVTVHNSIEQDSDVVLFLYGQNENEELLDTSKRLMKVLIAKHRNGPTGEIDMVFRGDRMRFYDVESSLEV